LKENVSCLGKRRAEKLLGDETFEKKDRKGGEKKIQSEEADGRG